MWTWWQRANWALLAGASVSLPLCVCLRTWLSISALYEPTPNVMTQRIRGSHATCKPSCNLQSPPLSPPIAHALAHTQTDAVTEHTYYPVLVEALTPRDARAAVLTGGCERLCFPPLLIHLLSGTLSLPHPHPWISFYVLSLEALLPPFHSYSPTRVPLNTRFS